MAKKVDVYVGIHADENLKHSGQAIMHRDKFHVACSRATVVIHEGNPERLFTESEVRAMVDEMIESVTAGEELTLETTAKKHGVSYPS